MTVMKPLRATQYCYKCSSFQSNTPPSSYNAASIAKSSGLQEAVLPIPCLQISDQISTEELSPFAQTSPSQNLRTSLSDRLEKAPIASRHHQSIRILECSPMSITVESALRSCLCVH